MAVVDWRADDTVAVVSMNNGENRHNPAFVAAFRSVLDEVLARPEIDALAITSTDPKHWSLGIELDWMLQRFQAGDLEAVRSFVRGMNDIFRSLLTLPMPVVAAVNGHATANGLILACAADFRIMRRDKGYARFPEVDIGIPFLPGMIAICRKAMPNGLLEDLHYSGRRATADELAAHHVISEAVEGWEAVLERSMVLADRFHKKRGIMGEMKRRTNADILRIMDTEDEAVIASGRLAVTG